jgi:hypothetical protein
VKKSLPPAATSRRPLLTLRSAPCREHLETLSLRRSIFSQSLSLGFMSPWGREQPRSPGIIYQQSEESSEHDAIA